MLRGYARDGRPRIIVIIFRPAARPTCNVAVESISRLCARCGLKQGGGRRSLKERLDCSERRQREGQ